MEKSCGKKYDLSFLKPPADGIYRCKIIYKHDLISVEYAKYERQRIASLALVFSDISYELKLVDRAEIDSLFLQRGDSDDILIIKNGVVTDTSIANVAFLKNGEWFTPARPLLEGTTRERLIVGGFLREANIKVDEIKEFDKIAIMNALRGFEPLGTVKEVIRF